MKRTIAKSKSWLGPTLFVGAAALALFLSSCNSSGVGIFYSLEKEVKIVPLTTTLPNDVVVGSMAMVTGTTKNWYFIGTGAIYEAPDETGAGISLTWTKIAAPSSMTSGARCTQLAAPGNGTTLYAIFAADTASNPAAATSALYTGTVDKATGKVTWGAAPAETAASLGDTNWLLQSLFVVSTQLYVLAMHTDPTTTNASFSLFGGTTNVAIGGLTGLTDPVVGGATDGANYWFVAGNTLYSSASATGTFAGEFLPTAILPSGATQNAVQFGGIYWSNVLSTLFVSTRNGYVYDGPGGLNPTTWSVAGTGPLTAMNGMVDLPIGSQTAFLIGCDSGYFESDLTGAPSTSTGLTPVAPNGLTASTDINYVNIALHTTAVTNFFVDSSDSTNVRLFALTEIGLWRNEVPKTGGARTWNLD